MIHLKQVTKSLSAGKEIFFVLSVAITGMTMLLINILGVDLYQDASLHSFWMHVLMVNITFMGDAWFAVGLLAWMAYKKHPAFRLCLFSCLLTTGFVQLINNLFSGWTLGWYVEQGQYLFFTDKAEHMAFPGYVSGHTALAFTLGGSLAGMAKPRWVVFVLTLAAIGVAISRLYLSGQGWMAVSAGIVAGFASYMLAGWILRVKIYLPKMPISSWMISGNETDRVIDPLAGS